MSPKTTSSKDKSPNAKNSRRNRDTESLYRPGQLSFWFLVTSVILLVSLLAMLWKDYARPWKVYQKDFYETMLRVERDATHATADQQDAELGELIDALAEKKKGVKAQFEQDGTFQQISSLRDDLHALQKDAVAADNRFKSVKGDHAVAKYEFEIARLHHDELLETHADENNADVKRALEAMETKRDALNYVATQWQAKKSESETVLVRVAELKRRIATLEAPWLEINKELADAQTVLTEQKDKVAGLAQKYENNPWRNAPFIDFISPTIKIEQVVLEDIHDNWNFATNRKVDRCMTCHAGIDMPSFGDPEIVNNPEFGVERYMRAHPKLGLIAGQQSPHPMGQVGCTVCHHGVGWAVDFARCAHSPIDAAQREQWEEDHDWYEAHYIDYPMLPLEYVQGMCHKCHKEGLFEPVLYEERLDHGFVVDDSARNLFAQRANSNDPAAEGFGDATANPLLPAGRVYGDWKMPPAPRPVGDEYNPFPSRHQVATQAREDLRDIYTDDDGVSPFFHDERVSDWGWSPDRYWQGYDSVVTYGCQGCHKIQDFGQQVDYDAPPRVAPDLTYIADKVKPEWLPLWIKHPDAYRVDTKMPSFYYFMRKDQFWEFETSGADGKRLPPLAVMDAHMTDPNANLETNYQSVIGQISGPADEARFAVEILAQTQYLLNQRNPATGQLWSRAEPSDPAFNGLYASEPPAGDVERGRDLVNTVGCVACHILPEIRTRDGYGPDGPERFNYDPLLMRGPRLQSLGSKIKSRQWLDAWLADPRHYTQTTRMPTMRLTEQERADVLDYLLSFKDETFDQMEAPGFKRAYIKTVKDMYVEFFTKDAAGNLKDPDAVDGEIGDLTNENRLATVLAMIGERLLSRNGCFGCHAVAGHEDDQPIGTELTKEGIKNLHMLDFGRVPKYVKTKDGEKVDVLPHTRHGFIRTKLAYPRIYDFSKQLIWQDKLKMPRFNFRMDDDLWQPRGDVSLGDWNDQPEGLAEGDEAWTDYYERRSTRASVAGIVLGLVDEPIKSGALFQPDAFQEDVIAGRRVAKRYGCNSCHTLEGKRGYLWGWEVDNRGADPGTLPPNLFAQGWRTRDEWLMGFLQKPEFLRPIVGVHMPEFGLSDAETLALVKYFKRLAGRARNMGAYNPKSQIGERRYDAAVSIERKGKSPAQVASAVDEAALLFNTINCNKCHLPPDHPLAGDDGGVAPSFDLSRTRLRHQWVRALLDGPGHLIDGTKMPAVYPLNDRKGGRDVLAEYQSFLFHLRDDADWMAAWTSEDKAARREAMTRLAEVQMDALSDYVIHHYEAPSDVPPAPAGGR